jgi:ABC-type methionine transport system ATPase subunit
VPLIEGLGLSRTAGEAEILKGVDIAVEKGEVLALIGPTGSGKTTLLRLLNMLDEPSRGTLLLEGADVFALPEAKRLRIRRRMSMVFQSPHDRSRLTGA